MEKFVPFTWSVGLECHTLVWNLDDCVRQALDKVTMELEQALGRLRMLENLIGFSTLTVYVDERGPQNDIPSSNDPFPWVDSLGVEATEWN